MSISNKEIEKSLSGRLRRIQEKWLGYEPVQELILKLTTAEVDRHRVSGLSGSSDAFLIAAISNATSRPIIVVTEKTNEAVTLYEDIVQLTEEETVGLYPSRQILPYDFRAPVGEIMGRRIAVLSDLLAGRSNIVVTSLRALIEPTILKENLKENEVRIEIGKRCDMDELIERLVMLGFRNVPLVEEVGDFARRGGLIDFFTPGSNAPVRVEFFDDEVETIRSFEVSTQRTIGRLNEVRLLPKREVPITHDSLESFLDKLPEEDADYIRDRYLNDPELPGLEWLSVLFGLKQGSLLDYLPDDTISFVSNIETMSAAADEIMDEAKGLYMRLSERLSRLPLPESYYHSFEQTKNRLLKQHLIEHLPFRKRSKDVIHFGCVPHPAFSARLDLLGKTIDDYNSQRIEYVVSVDNAPQGERLSSLLSEKSEYEGRLKTEAAPIGLGFVCEAAGVALLTDHEIFGRHRKRIRKKRFKEGVAISDYSVLAKNDFVVHTDHGIAQYFGLKTLQIDDQSRDCLLLQYADNDKLYVPIEEFNRVSKYSGKDGAPSLTRLGGPSWDKIKEKTKKAIADMAEELIALYAARKLQTGYSFGEDSVWLRQLEASFPHEETADQQKAIDDVKHDMSLERSMDRLICGDVGYGKTEVAVRAAFKAIDGGKQVAVLVPTTILAQQHFQTFNERMEDFPFKIGLLSRFRTRKQQLETVDQLADGKVDLVIGTHRLFSKDVAFRDLGLLIIDEEHRFGVRHKEKLRKLKQTVDTIAMTATPIPRTLQMSLIGARDMSIIETSPRDRLPIITEISEYDPAVVSTAILREINRDGQVFFVHNRVQTIDAMHEYLKELVPKAEIVVAHGQMHEKSLEGVMLGFMEKRFNVLLCTAIIESGLDIPSANTIIINRADRFGLAELYQIRGRVGRSSRRAYAYLLTPPIRQLKADAVKRLRAIEAHSDLGAGFALAMRDLEIRGAGTILGARQSGYIEEIGFDMYNRLLEEAVAKLKGQEIERLPETKLDVDAELLLPKEYIPENQQKVDIYRRIADARTLDDVERLREEIADRFGKLPQTVTDLLDATAVKISASLLEVEKVKMREGFVNIFFADGRTLTRNEVEAFSKSTDQPMEFSLIGNSRIDIDLTEIDQHSRLAYLRGVLGKIG